MLRHPNMEFENQPFQGISQNGWRHYRECLRTFPRIFPEYLAPFTEVLKTFSGMFQGIPQNVWRHSPDCLGTFPGMFHEITQNVRQHSPGLRIFGDIPRNISRHSWQCLRTLPGMFEGIPEIIWQYSQECLAISPGI